VRFQAGRGAPEKAGFETLIDWTTHADPGIYTFGHGRVYENL
jgi:hypothetical protein